MREWREEENCELMALYYNNEITEPDNMCLLQRGYQVCSTYLSNFLNGRGEYVEDHHPLLRRRPFRHFHQDHIGVEHQEAQVEELRHNSKTNKQRDIKHFFKSSKA